MSGAPIRVGPMTTTRMRRWARCVRSESVRLETRCRGASNLVPTPAWAPVVVFMDGLLCCVLDDLCEKQRGRARGSDCPSRAGAARLEASAQTTDEAASASRAFRMGMACMRYITLVLRCVATWLVCCNLKGPDCRVVPHSSQHLLRTHPPTGESTTVPTPSHPHRPFLGAYSATSSFG